MPTNAQPGDKIILTKPLGTRLAINAMQWLKTDKEKRAKILADSTEEKITDDFYRAEKQMATLSIAAARLVRKYQAHACTDVTGFGILGHADYLAQAQKRNVDFHLNRLPIYRNLLSVEGKVKNFRILEGTAAETSGGLLIVLPANVV